MSHTCFPIAQYLLFIISLKRVSTYLVQCNLQHHTDRTHQFKLVDNAVLLNERCLGLCHQTTIAHYWRKKNILIQWFVEFCLNASLIQSARKRLAQFYGLPKTHKEELAMRPIVSATVP